MFSNHMHVVPLEFVYLFNRRSNSNFVLGTECIHLQNHCIIVLLFNIVLKLNIFIDIIVETSETVRNGAE